MGEKGMKCLFYIGITSMKERYLDDDEFSQLVNALLPHLLFT